MSPAKKKAAPKPRKGFTAEEKAAMKEYIQEKNAGDADGESQLLAKIAGFAPSDKAMATRVHAIVKANAPHLTSRTWYGMPAYSKDGNVVCFFQDARKFKARYATLGFSDKAKLDDGRMWPTSYALTELTPAEEAKIVALIKKAAG